MLFKRNVFTRLERTLLNELRSNLTTEASELLRGQLETINLVQRHSRSREVCCYSRKWGVVFHNPQYQFPAQELELKFASLMFTCPKSENTWRAEFFLVRGYFFSIGFNPSPEEIKNSDAIRIEKVVIHHDPMRVGFESAPRRKKKSSPNLPEWLLTFRSDKEDCDAFEPPERDRRDAILREVDAVLPSDYLDLIDECDGLKVGEWMIFGLSEIYDVTLQDGKYYVLAERAGKGVIVIKAQAHDHDGLLYYFDYSRPEALAVGESLKTVMTLASALD